MIHSNSNDASNTQENPSWSAGNPNPNAGPELKCLFCDKPVPTFTILLHWSTCAYSFYQRMGQAPPCLCRLCRGRQTHPAGTPVPPFAEDLATPAAHLTSSPLTTTATATTTNTSPSSSSPVPAVSFSPLAMRPLERPNMANAASASSVLTAKQLAGKKCGFPGCNGEVRIRDGRTVVSRIHIGGGSVGSGGGGASASGREARKIALCKKQHLTELAEGKDVFERLCATMQRVADDLVQAGDDAERGQRFECDGYSGDVYDATRDEAKCKEKCSRLIQTYNSEGKILYFCSPRHALKYVIRTDGFQNKVGAGSSAKKKNRKRTSQASDQQSSAQSAQTAAQQSPPPVQRMRFDHYNPEGLLSFHNLLPPSVPNEGNRS